MRRTAARLANRHVRRLSRQSADRLMAIAAETGLAHKGKRTWLAERSEYERCYLIPVPAAPLRSADVRCLVVLLNDRNRAVWMPLDVSPWRVLGLPKLRGRELTDVVGSLAAASPVIRWDGTLSPGAPEPV